MDEQKDDRLPCDQPTDPVEQLTVKHVRPLPRIGEHLLKVDLFATVRTRLFLAHYTPATDAELVEP